VNHNTARPVFIEFTLPVTQAVRLLEICFKHGYTAAKLFPGYQGVAQHLQELAMLRRLSPDSKEEKGLDIQTSI
jgi:hypothetical protein